MSGRVVTGKVEARIGTEEEEVYLASFAGEVADGGVEYAVYGGLLAQQESAATARDPVVPEDIASEVPSGIEARGSAHEVSAHHDGDVPDGTFGGEDVGVDVEALMLVEVEGEGLLPCLAVLVKIGVAEAGVGILFHELYLVLELEG